MLLNLKDVVCRWYVSVCVDITLCGESFAAKCLWLSKPWRYVDTSTIGDRNRLCLQAHKIVWTITLHVYELNEGLLSCFAIYGACFDIQIVNLAVG